MKNTKQGIWIILVNGTEDYFKRFYTESSAIDAYELFLENRVENELEYATIELVRVLRTTNINEEPVDTTGDYKVYPSAEGK